MRTQTAWPENSCAGNIHCVYTDCKTGSHSAQPSSHTTYNLAKLLYFDANLIMKWALPGFRYEDFLLQATKMSDEGKSWGISVSIIRRGKSNVRKLILDVISDYHLLLSAGIVNSIYRRLFTPSKNNMLKTKTSISYLALKFLSFFHNHLKIFRNSVYISWL